MDLPAPSTPLRVLSTFSGIGGLDFGVHRAIGCRAVCYVEREAYCQATLVARMEEKALGQAPIWDDISTFDGHPWRGKVDLIIGGFPCQNISPAGNREGLEGAKSGLFFELARIIGEVRPRYLFLENVSAILIRGLPRVLGTLSELGYDVSWMVASAQEIGAPHLRKRWFGLGVLRDYKGRHPVLADADDSSRRPKQELKPKDGGGKPRGGGEELAHPDNNGRGIGSSINHPRRGDEPRDEPHRQDQRDDMADASISGSQGLRLTREDEPEDSRGAIRSGGEEIPHAEGGEIRELSERHQLESPLCGHPLAGHDGLERRPTFPPAPNDVDGWGYVLERWPDLVPAIPGRRTSIKTDAQPELRGVADGFPDWVLKAHQYRSDSLRALGNAVVPQQAEAAFRSLWSRLV